MVLQNPNAKKKAPVKKGEYVVKVHEKTPYDNEVDPTDSTKYTIDTRISDLITRVEECKVMKGSDHHEEVILFLNEYLKKMRYYRFRLIDAAYDPDYVSAMHPNTHHEIESKTIQQMITLCWQNKDFYDRVKTALGTIEIPEDEVD
jgi:hypothetical protein